MPTSTLPAADFTPEQLRLYSIPCFTVRADFTGGELSSDFGAVVLGYLSPVAFEARLVA